MRVEAIVLGTAQDGGVPQAGCSCMTCQQARVSPAWRRYVACLALVDHTTRQSWLIDATPDFREQLHLLSTLAPDCSLAGILLTHAHMGHYTGLMHLGREAMNTRDLPVYTTPRMAHFLRNNAPWSQLVTLGNVALRGLPPDVEVVLSPHLRVVPIPVPHRGEWSDTVAFLVRGPGRQLFYCPDIDSWDRWERDVRGFLAAVNVALLDATFFSADELPGRDMSQVSHPLVTETVERLAGTPCDVRLIHLNHSNPLHHPGPERDWLAAQGFRVAALGDRWVLD